MQKPVYILTCFVLLSLASQVMADRYMAPFDKGEWIVNESKLACELVHPIPGYGQAVFRQAGGQRLAFHLETSLGRLSATKAQIYDAPAFWKQPKSSELKRLAEITVSPSKYPVQLTKMTAYQMLYALAEGREPQIQFLATNDTIPNKKGMARSKEKDIVILTATKFQTAYKQYLSCVDDLVAYTFNDLKKSTFFFNSGSKALTAEIKTKLDAMAEYIRQDKDIYRIHLTGHSDSKGGYMANRQLANERMWLVKDYLVYKGVTPELFTLKGYGDRMPLGPNKTKEGRAKNRRVEVKIYR